MKTAFSNRFLKDIEKLTDAAVKAAVADAIEAVEAAVSITALNNLKKLTGFKTAYRIRIGDYRMGVSIANGTVEFAHFVHRRDIYKLFP